MSFLLSSVKRIQLVIIGAHIDHPVGHRWRGVDHVAGSSSPFLYQRRNRRQRKLRFVGVEATMLGIEAKLYPALHDELVIGRRCQRWCCGRMVSRQIYRSPDSTT